jgi:hypothetical protein
MERNPEGSAFFRSIMLISKYLMAVVFILLMVEIGVQAVRIVLAGDCRANRRLLENTGSDEDWTPGDAVLGQLSLHMD